jgi:hypothetical protein
MKVHGLNAVAARQGRRTDDPARHQGSLADTPPPDPSKTSTGQLVGELTEQVTRPARIRRACSPAPRC